MSTPTTSAFVDPTIEVPEDARPTRDPEVFNWHRRADQLEPGMRVRALGPGCIQRTITHVTPGSTLRVKGGIRVAVDTIDVVMGVEGDQGGTLTAQYFPYTSVCLTNGTF